MRRHGALPPRDAGCLIMARLIGQFDYIVVGAGSAGCLLANRLARDPQVRVLVLEAGGPDDWIWIHIPVGYIYCIGNPRTDWCYRTEPEPGLNGRSILYARGKVLGGCSSINAMLYLRGQAADYDGWARGTGDARWGWEQVLPVFRQTEDHWRGESPAHGAGGEWRVERQRLSWDILEAFSDAAVECGIPRVDDFNAGDNAGVARFEVNQRTGVRWNAAKAFLRPALARGNVTVLTGALAHRLRVAGRRVLGVEFEHEGELLQADAARETVLAAGSINTPQLLQLSGIGPGPLLQAHGIPVAHELPGVGEDLQDHLQLRMAFRVQGVRTLNELVHSWTGKLRIGLEYALRRSGPLAMAPSQLGAFARSDPGRERPNLEYHIQPLSLDRFGEPLHRFPAFTASVCNLQPTSRGSIRIHSPDPRVHPQIRPNYLSTDEDRAVAVDALRLTRRIVLGTQSLRRYAPEEFLPGPAFESDEDLARAAGDVGTTIFHPVGTCRMGRAEDPGAVVDSELRVRGLQGLRIADASVMPRITSGNTNAPTLMIAERAAALILGHAESDPALPGQAPPG
jgi:choline dehydrogenase